MPYLGLKWVIIVGAVIDIGLGMYLAFRIKLFSESSTSLRPLVAAIVMMFFAAGFVGLDTEKMASGVFRYGSATGSGNEVIFHKDGKTSTVAVKTVLIQQPGMEVGEFRTLVNNGKPDASVWIPLPTGQNLPSPEGVYACLLYTSDAADE